LRLAYLLGSLLVLSASLHAPTAYSAIGDPPTGSPAGAVYELPLERGRSDGAPKTGGGPSGEGGAGGAAGGAGSGEAASLYRSENNFGSSSRVPGVAAVGAAGVGAAAVGAAAVGAGTGSDDGADRPGAAGALARSEIAGAGNTSISANLALLGVIALLALAIGVLTRRFGC
jgi:hypothetical protein